MWCDAITDEPGPGTITCEAPGTGRQSTSPSQSTFGNGSWSLYRAKNPFFVHPNTSQGKWLVIKTFSEALPLTEHLPGSLCQASCFG